MLFGLTNTLRVFQIFINNIFSRLSREQIINILRWDILVATEDMNEHLEILKEIFQIAKQNKLVFRLDKCSFLYEEIVYLGYTINQNGIQPSKNNIDSVLNYSTPRNIKEAYRFVCLVSYFRRFIKNFTTIAQPLYNLI